MGTGTTRDATRRRTPKLKYVSLSTLVIYQKLFGFILIASKMMFLMPGFTRENFKLNLNSNQSHGDFS